MGAVEIGTIAEAETDDEEDEEVIEGKEYGIPGCGVFKAGIQN